MNNNVNNLHNSNNINFQGQVGKSARKYINQCCKKELNYLQKRASLNNTTVNQNEACRLGIPAQQKLSRSVGHTCPTT